MCTDDTISNTGCCRLSIGHGVLGISGVSMIMSMSMTSSMMALSHAHITSASTRRSELYYLPRI